MHKPTYSIGVTFLNLLGGKPPAERHFPGSTEAASGMGSAICGGTHESLTQQKKPTGPGGVVESLSKLLNCALLTVLHHRGAESTP